MKLLRTKRMEFYRNQAKENPSNARVIFGTANKPLQRNIDKKTLPKHKSTSELAEEFSAFSANKISTIRQCLGNNNITTSPSARNIGAIFDEHLTMEAHVNSVCRSSFFHLHVYHVFDPVSEN